MSLSTLIISYHSSLNNGDRALLEMNISQLQAAFSNPNITVASTWPNEHYFNKLTDVLTIPSAWRLIDEKWENKIIPQLFNYFRAEIYARKFVKGRTKGIPANWVSLFKAYDQADLIASVSSTHFYSTGRYGWPFPVKIFMANLAHIFGKPLYVLPQSIGPLRWNWEVKMLKTTFQKGRLIFLRDYASMQLAQKLGLRNVLFAPDPAFAYPPTNQQIAYQTMKKYGYNSSDLSLGLTLIPRQSRAVSSSFINTYYTQISRALQFLHKELNVKVYLFNQVTGPTHYDDDRGAIKSLLNFFDHQYSWLTHVDEILPPALLKACYGLMSIFLATRLHSGIFSLSMGVPVVFIGYGTKTRGMMQGLGLEEWVIDLNNISTDEIVSKIFKAWEKRVFYKEKLSSIIPNIQKQVFETANIIKTDYENIRP